MYKPEYTHGGGPLKNLALAMRAILNIIAFFMLWLSLAIELDVIYTVIFAIALAATVIWNLIIPFTRRKK